MGDPLNATNAPSPPLEPPAPRAVFLGFKVRPNTLLWESAVWILLELLDSTLCLVITHHHGLWDIGLDEWDCTQREQDLNKRRIGLGKLIEIGNQTDSGLGTNDMEGIFETHGQTVKRTGKFTVLSQLVELLSA